MRAKPPDAPLRRSAATDLRLPPFLPPTFDVGLLVLDVSYSAPPPAPRPRFLPFRTPSFDVGCSMLDVGCSALPPVPRPRSRITDHLPLAARHLPLSLSLLLLTLGTGCGLLKTATNVPGQAVRAVTPGKTDQNATDLVDVQEKLLRFAHDSRR